MKKSSKELKDYFTLMGERPELFLESEIYPIVKDYETILKFEKDTGKKIGVLYASEYNMLLADLIHPEGKEMFVYERIVPVEPNSIVVVAICQNRFVLLKQYRHAIRDFQYSFVRGYGAFGLSPEENAEKELFEEIGSQFISSKFLGYITADSGLTAGITAVYLCEITEPKYKSIAEGIKEVHLVDPAELEKMIAERDINDGMTLAAYALYEIE